jgi:hypothetical protein
MLVSYSQYYTSEGTPTRKTEPIIRTGGEIAYCANCNKRLGKFIYDCAGKATTVERMEAGIVEAAEGEGE